MSQALEVARRAARELADAGVVMHGEEEGRAAEIIARHVVAKAEAAEPAKPKRAKPKK